MNTLETNARKPWVAVLLSLFCTGLGQVYCGRIVAGSVLFLASLTFVPFALGLATFEVSTVVLLAFIVSSFAVAGISLYAAIDAYRLARRLGANYQPKDYNRPIVYAVFIVAAGFTCPVGAAMFVRANVVEAFYCPAESMAPSILRGDRFLVNKLAYRRGEPDRGDILVFLNPQDRQINYVKRLIGLPGDRVEVRAGEVYLNGQKLPHEPADESKLRSAHQPEGEQAFYESNGGRRYLILRGTAESETADYPETVVPAGHVFVLGDHRDRSKDSRAFGFVPLGDVKGRAEYIYLPAASWSRFGECR